MQLENHPMPETRARYDYSHLMGWQVSQCITVDRKSSLRIKGYFERNKGWKFTERTQPDGKVRLWRKS
jgi:hypothetical protein